MSLSEPCVFILKDMIVLVYVDDFILISKEDYTIQKFIDSMKDTPEGFEFTEEGTINAYLGVDSYPLLDGKGFTLSQPFFIDRNIQASGFDQKTTKGATNNTQAVYPPLNKDENGPSSKASWKYRGIIGMFGYLQGTTHPEITMKNHQCAIFNNDPHFSHDQAVKRIGRYLLDTRDKGIIYRPETSRGPECYVDADFAGGWKDGYYDYPESVLP